MLTSTKSGTKPLFHSAGTRTAWRPETRKTDYAPNSDIVYAVVALITIAAITALLFWLNTLAPNAPMDPHWTVPLM